MAKARDYLLAALLGAVLGAGITAGIFIGINRGRAESQRSIVLAYQSALADRGRQLEQLDSQLRESGALAVEARNVNEQLLRAFEENVGNLRSARTDYERGVVNLKLAARIYDILRRHYEKNY